MCLDDINEEGHFLEALLKHSGISIGSRPWRLGFETLTSFISQKRYMIFQAKSKANNHRILFSIVTTFLQRKLLRNISCVLHFEGTYLREYALHLEGSYLRCIHYTWKVPTWDSIHFTTP